MKYLRTFSIICILGLLYSSCVKKENYSIIPAITYNSFIPFCSGSTTDSAYLRVNFTDGDGDIGYPQGDVSAPKDFFVVPYIYVYSTKSFQPITNTTNNTVDTVMFSYLIPNITPSGSDKELNGIIQINLEDFIQEDISSLVTNPTFNSIANVHELQFQVWIFDRAGHKSNVITTPVVYSCQ